MDDKYDIEYTIAMDIIDKENSNSDDSAMDEVWGNPFTGVTQVSSLAMIPYPF